MYFIKLFLHSEKIKKAIYNNDSFLSTAPNKKENKVLLKQGFIFYGAGTEAGVIKKLISNYLFLCFLKNSIS